MLFFFQTFVFMKREEDTLTVTSSEAETLIPVVCTDSTLQPDSKLICMTIPKTKKEFSISVQKITDKIENAQNLKINKRYDNATADSSFSSENKKKAKISHDATKKNKLGK